MGRHRRLLQIHPSLRSLEDEEVSIVSEINITPLTDIFLVLLIIFMVTSSVMNQSGMDVHLPSASASAAETSGEETIVTLLPNGKLLVNRQEVPSGDLKILEKKIRESFPSSIEASRVVILEGDKDTFLGMAVQVMDIAKKAGASKIAISTDSGKSIASSGP